MDVYVDEPPKKRVKSKWGGDTKVFVPMPTYIPQEKLTQLELEALIMRFRIEELTQKLQAPQLEFDTADDRSPSPPPIYDRDGKRTNTREQRTRQAYLLERQSLIQRASSLAPTFKPPADYRPITVRKNKKIYIPIEKYPEYNFIGLIIGPRGMTQKQMEADSGAKIAIRGKGSVKDGKINSGDDDRLHVLIMAETDDQIDKAARMVEKLLVPIAEGRNEHKRQQLRKLAEINGTLRDNMMWKRDLERNFDGPQVSCAFCGDYSHPSRDCPVKGRGAGGDDAPRTKIDSEYENFLAEIGEAPAPSSASSASSAPASSSSSSSSSLSGSTSGGSNTNSFSRPSSSASGGGGYQQQQQQQYPYQYQNQHQHQPFHREPRVSLDAPEIQQAYLDFMAAIGLEPSSTAPMSNSSGGGGGGGSGGGNWDQPQHAPWEQHQFEAF